MSPTSCNGPAHTVFDDGGPSTKPSPPSAPDSGLGRRKRSVCLSPLHRQPKCRSPRQWARDCGCPDRFGRHILSFFLAPHLQHWAGCAQHGPAWGVRSGAICDHLCLAQSTYGSGANSGQILILPNPENFQISTRLLVHRRLVAPAPSPSWLFRVQRRREALHERVPCTLLPLIT